MGSAAVGAWIAYLTFIGLIAVGLASGELGARGPLVTLWFALLCGWASERAEWRCDVSVSGAVVDVALVLVIVNGDVKF